MARHKSRKSKNKTPKKSSSANLGLELPNTIKTLEDFTSFLYQTYQITAPCFLEFRSVDCPFCDLLAADLAQIKNNYPHILVITIPIEVPANLNVAKALGFQIMPTLVFLNRKVASVHNYYQQDNLHHLIFLLNNPFYYEFKEATGNVDITAGDRRVYSLLESSFHRIIKSAMVRINDEAIEIYESSIRNFILTHFKTKDPSNFASIEQMEASLDLDGFIATIGSEVPQLADYVTGANNKLEATEAEVQRMIEEEIGKIKTAYLDFRNILFRAVKRFATYSLVSQDAIQKGQKT